MTFIDSSRAREYPIFLSAVAERLMIAQDYSLRAAYRTDQSTDDLIYWILNRVWKQR